MLQRIEQLAQKFESEIIETFRHLHAHPELSFQETETAKYVCNALSEMQIPYESGIGTNGILARIECKNPAKGVIALRADMDALPIQEETDLDWKSLNDGVMHACGHDAHTASLLGAARVLNEIKDQMEGTILLVFQPGEELAPGGANLMLQAGVFDKYKPDLIIGQHVSEDFPTGTLAFRSGIIMASADEIYITIRGKGGHAAKPHLVNDTVLAAAQTLVSLQQVRSRLCPPLTPMVLSFGKIVANGAANVIPHEVKLSGTFRTYDESWRNEAKEHICRIVNETAAAYGCTAEINIPDGYPSLTNNDALTQKLERYARQLLGKDHVVEFEQRLTSEDFAFFAQKYPACFYRFGIKSNSNKNCGRSHTSTFRVDEASLFTATKGLAWFAYSLLNA